LSQLSTGLSRAERRYAMIPGGGGALVVYSYAEAAAIIGVSKRTFERLLAEGEGPEVIELSRRRFGVANPALRAWIKTRKRITPPDAPANARRRA
jgi:excisionase family DNA binding protein